jgi:nitrogen fixation-related uncharacterized protein
MVEIEDTRALQRTFTSVAAFLWAAEAGQPDHQGNYSFTLMA